MQITHRPATPADALCLGVLATQVFLDTYAPDGLRPDLAREALSTFSTEAMARTLADPAVRVLLAERNGHLIGFVELALDRVCPAPSEARAEIARLYVLRRFQGQGVGRALSDRAQQLAAQYGHAALWLTAWAGNAPALAFYAREGWTDIGMTHHVFEDQAFENRVLVKAFG